MTKPKPRRRGPDATTARIAEMRRDGYALRHELATKYEVGESTIRLWEANGQLPQPPGVTKAVSVKRWGFRWYLAASVALKAKGSA